MDGSAPSASGDAGPHAWVVRGTVAVAVALALATVAVVVGTLVGGPTEVSESDFSFTDRPNWSARLLMAAAAALAGSAIVAALGCLAVVADNSRRTPRR